MQLFTAEEKLDLQRGLAEQSTDTLARNTCLDVVEGLNVSEQLSVYCLFYDYAGVFLISMYVGMIILTSPDRCFISAPRRLNIFTIIQKK